MPTFTLSKDGDHIEQINASRFLNNEFPAYEEFWRKFVVPLTNRPKNIHFKNQKQLRKAGKSDNDICIAQLHYSILRHFHRTYEIRQIPHSKFSLFLLTDGFVRLSGAIDIAFELLERFQYPTKYNPWEETGSKSNPGGREARRNWQTKNSFPLQNIKNYRNHLIHGRMTPTLSGNQLYLPKIGTEKKYFDWRLVTNPTQQSVKSIRKNFIAAKSILKQAWNETINYIQVEWQNNLLP